LKGEKKRRARERQRFTRLDLREKGWKKKKKPEGWGERTSVTAGTQEY